MAVEQSVPRPEAITMPLALTCDCGARFDVDELLAAREVPCPECGQAVHAPAHAAAAPRTSLWALAAVVLALFGAFTLVGTVLAVVVGLCALVVIRRQPERLKGARLALGAIAAGVVLSLASVAVLARPEALPMASWLRQRSLGGQVDTTGTLQMLSRSGDVVVDRPSRDWGRARNDQTDDPVVGELQQKQKLDLLLVNVRRHAYVDVFRDTSNSNVELHQYTVPLAEALNPPRVPLVGEDDRRNNPWGQPEPQFGPFTPKFKHDKRLEPVDGYNVREWEVDQARGGQRWWFIIRVYKKQVPRIGDAVFVVRAYTPKRRRSDNEEELRAVLDTVRIPQ
jgi:hypothetical protein